MQGVALLTVQRRECEQFQHPQHAAQWGADFMAHGSQKGILGAAGLFGALLGLLQQQLVLLASGNVAHRTGVMRLLANHHFADGQLDREGAAILASPHDFPSFADDLWHMAGTVVAQVAIMGLAVRARHQHLDVLSDHFGGVVAKNPLSGRIDGLDNAEFINGQNAIHDGVQNTFNPVATIAQLHGRQALIHFQFAQPDPE